MRWLARKPLDIPAYSFPVMIGLFRRSLVVLCHPNNLSRVPKSVPFNVQADFTICEQNGDYLSLCTEMGIIYSWDTAVHSFLRK